jgi:hypothetical protein
MIINYAKVVEKAAEDRKKGHKKLVNLSPSATTNQKS